jgi:hypothetical protein
MSRKQANVVAQMKRHGSWMLCKFFFSRQSLAVTKLFRLFNNLHLCLRRILSVRYAKHNPLKGLVVAGICVNSVPCSHLRDPASISNSAQRYCMGLLLLAYYLGMHVFNIRDKLAHGLVSGPFLWQEG